MEQRLKNTIDLKTYTEEYCNNAIWLSWTDISCGFFPTTARLQLV